MARTTEHLYPQTRVSEALQQASDEILAAVEAPDTGLRDGFNALINVAMWRLENPEGSLEEAIQAMYCVDAEQVLAWIET